jgi:PAS domain S-box-containing protein
MPYLEVEKHIPVEVPDRIKKHEGIRMTANADKQKKMKKPSAEKRVRRGERVRLEGLVADARQSRDDVRVKNQRQADQLKIKNVQLRHGAAKQIWSEEQIRIHTQAMESTADGIFIIDAKKQDFPVIYANKSFQKMTGYPKREIPGRNYFSFYGADADQRIVDEIKHTMHSGRSFHGEMLSFKKDGKKCWNSLRIAPVRDASGAVTHYVGTQTDVTLLREKESEIDEQREELLHVTRVGKLAEFVSSLAHEISQPLTAILSCAQAAQRMPAGKDPQLRKILSYIIDDDRRAVQVIQRLRSLLKKGAREMKQLDINALINETVVLIATDAVVRNCIIKTDFDAHLPSVCGDRVQLQQVLLNLISNSLDAMEGRHGARRIVIRTSCKDAHAIVVSVEDSGCGVPARNMSKLFNHFFTSKADGLGMGLSISRSIVESHGGRLDVKNNPDRGAIFYFTIPVHVKGA